MIALFDGSIALYWLLVVIVAVDYIVAAVKDFNSEWCQLTCGVCTVVFMSSLSQLDGRSERSHMVFE